MKVINSTAIKERAGSIASGNNRQRREKREKAKPHKAAKTAAGVLLAVSAVVFFLAFPDKLTASARDGLLLCYRSVIPSVFPFLVINGILIRLGFDVSLSRPLSGVMEKVFHLNGNCAAPVLLGAVCGFPTGARTAYGLYSSGRISREEAETVIAFTNNASPAFLIAGVGSAMLGRADVGAVLYVIQLVSSLITGILLRPKIFLKGVSEAGEKTDKIEPLSFSDFSKAVADASRAIILICGSVVFFSVLSGFLLACDFLPMTLRIIFCSLLELTTGVGAAASLGVGKTSILLIAFAIGFSGMSVFAQIGAVTGGELNMKKYYIGRLISSFFCVFLSFLYININIF